MYFITAGNQETAETSPLDEIDDVKETIKPTEKSSGIKIIEGRSFVFDHSRGYTFLEAKLFCKGRKISECIFIFTPSSKKMNKITFPLLFSLGLNGQVFEPHGKTLYGKVVEAFEKEFTLNNRGFWIGVKYSFKANNFQYISTKNATLLNKVPLDAMNTHEFCTWADSGTRMKDWRAKQCSNWPYPGAVCEII